MRFTGDSRKPMPIIGGRGSAPVKCAHDQNVSRASPKPALLPPAMDGGTTPGPRHQARPRFELPHLARRAQQQRLRAPQFQESPLSRPSAGLDRQEGPDSAGHGGLSSLRRATMRECRPSFPRDAGGEHGRLEGEETSVVRGPSGAARGHAGCRHRADSRSLSWHRVHRPGGCARRRSCNGVPDYARPCSQTSACARSTPANTRISG